MDRLINALGPGERISLSKLAITHLERTSRPIRIAVDISIWLFQVQAGRGGRNPELRTLFFRLLKILSLPIHPLFVYDGKDKPPFKRGKAVSGRSYGNAPIIQLSKILIDLFKFPRHDAPGEAEAECARLQTAGVVDAVMSNDVDALMFGSTLTVMNFSKESASGAATHVTCYQMGNGDTSKVMLDRPGMILFAMLSGGDYLPSGVPKCGSKLAAEIAKAGFGADLLEVLEADGAELDARLSEWRERLQYELEENESGYFQTKHKVVRIPESFPDRTILSYYAKPVVSSDQAVEELKVRLRNAWDQEIDVVQLRQFTADAFEWNYRSGARKVIRLLAEPLVSYKLRLGQHPLAPGRPRLSNNDAPVLQKVYKSRTSFTTDGMAELQVEIIPVDVVGLDLLSEVPNPPMPSQETATSGDEEEEGEGDINAEAASQSPVKKRTTKRYDPYAVEKVWIFETLASIGIPEVVENWKKEEAARLSAPKKTASRKPGPRKRKELDPSMKQGSILKYGTLKKGRSDISQNKSAQLFEAAISTASPTKSTPHSSPGGYGLPTMSPERPNQRLDGFDYLVDRFASCNLSASPVKRRPVINRAPVSRRTAVGSSVAEVEVIEISSGDDLPPSPLPGRIRMSYSNASYKELNCHNYFSQPYKNTRSRTKPKPSQEQEGLESSVVKDLEHAISSMNLNCPEPKAAKTKPATKISRRKKSEKTNPPVEDATPVSQGTSEPSEVQPVSRRQEKATRKQKPATAESQPGTTEQPKESCTETAKPQKPPTHLESITVCGGYWTVDSTSQGEKKDETKEEKGSKRRIARVSILDLT